MKEGCLIKKWEPKQSEIIGYKSQIAFFKRQYPYAKLTCQRGSQIDIFLPNKIVGQDYNGLSWQVGIGCLSKTQLYNTNFLKVVNTTKTIDQPTLIHCTHVTIKEQGYLKGGLKRRIVTQLVLQQSNVVGSTSH